VFSVSPWLVDHQVPEYDYDDDYDRRLRSVSNPQSAIRN